MSRVTPILLMLSLIGAVAGSVSAVDPLFDAPVHYAVGFQPVSVFSADFDDGWRVQTRLDPTKSHPQTSLRVPPCRGVSGRRSTILWHPTTATRAGQGLIEIGRFYSIQQAQASCCK